MQIKMTHTYRSAYFQQSAISEQHRLDKYTSDSNENSKSEKPRVLSEILRREMEKRKKNH